MQSPGERTFDELVREAVAVELEGWDLGALFGDRYEEAALPWDYRALARRYLDGAGSALDLGTGGGEFLRELGSLPAVTAATEAYAPNVEVARRGLEPLGVDVRAVTEDSAALPFPSETFEVVLSRHEAFDAAEVRRVLRPGGVLLTQQVGGADLCELNDALGGPSHAHGDLDLSVTHRSVERAGLDVLLAEEARTPARFADIGACVLFLRLTPWQVPGFSVPRYERALRALDARMRAEGGLRVSAHRFVLVARRPAG